MSFRRQSDHLMTRKQAESVERGSGKMVVAALDESALADEVFEFVCTHFNSPDVHVVFTYVSKPLDSLFNSFAAQANEAQCKGYLVEGWVNRAEELQMKMKCTGKVLVGDAREELCAFCEHLKPDLLVMGSHGRNALSRMMLGSVSDYCVHFCPCPVAVVKPNKELDTKGYSSIFRIAMKAFGAPKAAKDQAQAQAGEGMEEIVEKMEKLPGGEKAEEKGGKVDLEDVLPMESPFPPEAGQNKFPLGDAPFAVVDESAKSKGDKMRMATAPGAEGEGVDERVHGERALAQEGQGAHREISVVREGTGVEVAPLEIKGIKEKDDVQEMGSPFSPGSAPPVFPISESPFPSVTGSKVGGA